jgi:outer membrane immunogenic protein
MKKAILALVAATAFTGSAFAADLARKAPPPPPPPPIPSFTGCWLSGGVGYGLWDQENTEFDRFGFIDEGVPFGAQLTDTFTTGGKGWLGRVGAGCDYQFSFLGNQQWVIGGFADYDWTDLNGRLVSPSIDSVGSETMNNQWAVGGRIGWVALPNLMTFVSGGYTQAHFNGTAFTDLFFPHIGVANGFFRDPATYKGWFIGGGEEYAFTWLPWPGLFWKTEYRVSEFDRQAVVTNFIAPGGAVVPALATDSKKWVQTITTSLVWRFNFGGAPLVAKY